MKPAKASPLERQLVLPGAPIDETLWKSSISNRITECLIELGGFAPKVRCIARTLHDNALDVDGWQSSVTRFLFGLETPSDDRRR